MRDTIQCCIGAWFAADYLQQLETYQQVMALIWAIIGG